ncbi:hypothetical protein, partial [Helicobacter sp. T3_23-1056]
ITQKACLQSCIEVLLCSLCFTRLKGANEAFYACTPSKSACCFLSLRDSNLASKASSLLTLLALLD